MRAHPSEQSSKKFDQGRFLQCGYKETERQLSEKKKILSFSFSVIFLGVPWWLWGQGPCQEMLHHRVVSGWGIFAACQSPCLFPVIPLLTLPNEGIQLPRTDFSKTVEENKNFIWVRSFFTALTHGLYWSDIKTSVQLHVDSNWLCVNLRTQHAHQGTKSAKKVSQETEFLRGLGD